MVLAALTTVLVFTSSTDSMWSVGPAAFIIMHQMELLRTIILIGVTQNEFIEDVLSSSINIFSLLMIPDKYVPQITGKFALERVKTEGELDQSGYSEGTTFYLLIILFIQAIIF